MSNCVSFKENASRFSPFNSSSENKLLPSFSKISDKLFAFKTNRPSSYKIWSSHLHHLLSINFNYNPFRIFYLIHILIIISKEKVLSLTVCECERDGGVDKADLEPQHMQHLNLNLFLISLALKIDHQNLAQIV